MFLPLVVCVVVVVVAAAADRSVFEEFPHRYSYSQRWG